MKRGLSEREREREIGDSFDSRGEKQRPEPNPSRRAGLDASRKTHTHTEEEEKKEVQTIETKATWCYHLRYLKQNQSTQPNTTKTPGSFLFVPLVLFYFDYFFGKLTHMPIAGDRSWCYWVLLFFLFSVCCSLFFSLVSKQNTNRTK